MGDFIVKDSLQDPRAGFVPPAADAFEGVGCHIQPACFEHHRHHGQPRRDIVPRFKGGIPQPIVGREGAIMRSQAAQPACEQREMHRFVCCDREKVGNEARSHLRPEPSGHVEREVDGDEFNMGERMPQRDPPAFGARLVALGHAVGWQQFGLCRPGRTIRHGAVEDEFQFIGHPVTRDRAGGKGLVGRVCG